MSPFERLAEERIARAVQAGELSGLPGEGRPLELDEQPFVPEHDRALMRVLKHAGHVPEQVHQLREMRDLERQLSPQGSEPSGRGSSPVDRVAAERRLLALRLKLEAAGLSLQASGVWAEYGPRVQARLRAGR